MMRHNQSRVARKASRRALLRSTPTGVIAWIRTYNRLQLGLALASLALSVLLLFTGTYVTFEASLQVGPRSEAQRPLTDTLLALYGITEADFGMLYPAERPLLNSTLSSEGRSITNNSNYKLTNCKSLLF